MAIFEFIHTHTHFCIHFKLFAATAAARKEAKFENKKTK